MRDFPIDARHYDNIRRRLAELGRRSARYKVAARAPFATVYAKTIIVGMEGFA